MRRSGALLALALAGALCPVAPAFAAESYPLTADTLPIAGHGYGHGRGMGQYGAQGAALQGRTAQQILDFYYPGTVTGPLPAPATVRVLVAEDTDDDVTVWPAPGLAVTDADGRRWVLPAGPDRWRLVADPSTGQHVEQLVAGHWSEWVRPGGGAFYQGRFDGPAVLRLALPDGTSRGYRGALTAARGTGTALTTVDQLAVEDYLRSVVPSESPASWAGAALQAQAVAARTYAAYKRAAARTPGYDICSTTACQVYRGAISYDSAGRPSALEDARTDAAVNATAGQVRLWGGALALTEFTSSTGGMTTSGGVPYLSVHADPYDDFAGNPVHTWRTALTQGSVRAAYPQIGTPTRVRVLARDGNGEWGGRVTSVALDGTAGSVTVSGDALRVRLGLREAWWGVDLGLIQLYWRELGGSAGPLGAARTDEYAVPAGRAQDFAAGSVLWSPSTGAHEVHGLIGQRYAGLGGAGGPLGLPVADEQAVPGGRGSAFVGGRLYWSPATAAHEVHGLILAGYLDRGGPDRFGLPVTDEQVVAGGRSSRFTDGAWYWSPGTGAHEVHGAILAAYDRLGGSSSSLGLPTSDEQVVPGGRRSDFTGGALFWDATTGRVTRLSR